MTTTLLGAQAASREYATRPPDERYPSLDALVTAAEHDRQHSMEKKYNLKDLQVVPFDNTDVDRTGPRLMSDDPGVSLRLQSPKGRAQFTHWSFNQACRMIGAPAAYLRTLPPAIAADAMNHGLSTSPVGTQANVLIRLPNGNGQTEPIARACTSDTYGRVWDSQLYSAVVNGITQHDSRWTLPPTWTGEPAGAYRGDRDSFLVLVNGGSIVTDPSLRNAAPFARTTPDAPQGPTDGMYRGLLIRNSEVGAASIIIEQILFRFICGNHMLWGAFLDRSFRRRHFGANTLRDTVTEINRIAWNWTHQSAARDEQIVKSLIEHEIAHTRDAVIDELRKLGATREQAEQAYKTCEATETASPRSFWGLAQGLTRDSQQTPYQDERFELDRIAAAVLNRARKLVAA